MAVKSFMTNNLVADMQIYNKFDGNRRAEIKKDGPQERLFYKPGLIGDPSKWREPWYQKKKKIIFKCACMVIAYDIWYDYVHDRAIDDGATTYKKFVDVPKTVLSTIKRVFENEIKVKCCDYDCYVNHNSPAHYDFCRYLAMYWTYLECAKDTKIQRYFPTQLTITRAAKIFGYEEGENPFKMNGRYFYFNDDTAPKTTGREINAIPKEKVQEVIDEFMNDRKETENFEDITIDQLDLTTRTYNSLLRGGIRTIGDILKTRLCDLIKIRNFGRRSLEEVQEILKKYGYQYIIGNPDHYEEVPALFCNATVADIKANIKSLADEILELWGKGYNTLGIAEKLNIPEGTVREKLTTAGIRFDEIKLTKVADIWDSLTKDEKDSVTRQIVSADNLKAADELTKKMSDFKEENEALRIKYEKLNSMYLNCASQFENLKEENKRLKKENEDLEQTNKMLSDGKLEDMQAYERLNNRFEELCDEYNKCRQTMDWAQTCRHDVSTMIREVIDSMRRDKIEEIGVIVDGFVVQIHPRKDEKKLGTYTIRTRESIV